LVCFRPLQDDAADEEMVGVAMVDSEKVVAGSETKEGPKADFWVEVGAVDSEVA